MLVTALSQISDYFTHFTDGCLSTNSTDAKPAHFPRTISFLWFELKVDSLCLSKSIHPRPYHSCRTHVLPSHVLWLPFPYLIPQNTGTVPYAFSFHSIYQNLFHFKIINWSIMNSFVLSSTFFTYCEPTSQLPVTLNVGEEIWIPALGRLLQDLWKPLVKSPTNFVISLCFNNPGAIPFLELFVFTGLWLF